MAHLYFDTETGTFGAAEGNLVILDVTEDEVEFLDQVGDSIRNEIVKLMDSNRDQSEYDVYSAHAALVSTRSDKKGS